ncbi:uncharacterized protein NECHADRAFT_85163 [Fusarium vanettenii 77-13-4]|uniref:Uncharacterized protein n=1 Tax=Fusarium vanettenii (strain ATCC MYA-4622 / CBS 123669 / FGSC 9596 / NRRL 45880 / 77-13-4) TaxID=660122 RepID=C7YV61_FUSV7|nr:uncharacterized protein NECHADRAFT_85163 [Fusarium vanettenii 77-13-4]EEU44524.1 predicted protein [Fusarium vanettenii 77-13-4]
MALDKVAIEAQGSRKKSSECHNADAPPALSLAAAHLERLVFVASAPETLVRRAGPDTEGGEHPPIYNDEMMLDEYLRGHERGAQQTNLCINEFAMVIEASTGLSMISPIITPMNHILWDFLSARRVTRPNPFRYARRRAIVAAIIAAIRQRCWTDSSPDTDEFGLGFTRGREMGARLGTVMGFMAGTCHGMDWGYASGHWDGFRAGVAYGIAQGQMQWNW